MARFKANQDVRIWGIWRDKGQEFELADDDAVIAGLLDSQAIESLDEGFTPVALDEGFTPVALDEGFTPAAFAQAETDADDEDLDEDNDDEDLDDIPEEAKAARVARPEPPPVSAAKAPRKKARR